MSPTEQIKDRLGIVDVVSSYIKLEKSGINYKARCPFHNEKTPSFFVSPARQSFYCFGCGAKGDIFSFVEQFEGLDFKGALEELAKKAGVELKKSDFKKEVSDKKERLFKIMEEASKIYESGLEENEDAKKYLEKRGLRKETISKWQIGFARDGWRNLHDALLKKSFSKEEMLKTGLIKKAVPKDGDGNEAEKYYDTFRNRVMFPISNANGRVVAFSGRLLGESDAAPKYLNSPETELFFKSETLYGFHLAKNHIRKMDYAVLVEGQMDLIMSHQSGVLNTVASSGTALSPLSLSKIQRLTNRLIIAYDGDEAGEKAARRAAEIALPMGMEVKIALLEKGEDPDSIIRKDPEEWKKVLREAKHFAEFEIEKTFRRHDGRNLLKKIVSDVLPVLSLVKSEIEKSQLIKKIADKMGVPQEAVLKDMKETSLQELTESGEKSSFKTKDLEQMMAGFVFWEESQKESLDRNFREKWQNISSFENVSAILENFEKDKEALIFEIENYGDFEQIIRVGEEALKRIELKYLKSELKETAEAMDKAKNRKEKELEEKLQKIQKRIAEIGG